VPTRKDKLLDVLPVVLGACFLVCWAFYGALRFRDRASGGYWTFLGKNQQYYMRFARACDSLMVAHPMGTNQIISIATTDPSVSAIIRDLKPNEIQVQSNRVWMMIGASHAGFVVAWEPQSKRQGNVWAIDAIIEGTARTPYVESRLIPSAPPNPTRDQK
jgi:hypothetical protein